MTTSRVNRRAQSISLACALSVVGAGLMLDPPTLLAQAPSTPQAAGIEVKVPIYDVVSIKPNKSGSRSVHVHTNGDRYQGTNVSIAELIEEAYGIKERLISGLSGPIASAHFDIEAKVLEPDPATMKGLTNQQRQSMLRPILAERFKLIAHTEIKTLPVYDLVVAKGGPKFKQSPSDSKGGDGISIHNTELEAHDISMVSFAKYLTDQVERTVVDKTGLAGTYDLVMKWSPDDVSQPDDGSAEASAPSIFTALQEQLGLKLQPSRGPVETFVVDYVDLPSEN